jgi:hypothetical protein
MPNLQYHVVKTDKGELEIIAANEMEVRNGWVPGKILHSCADEKSAKKKLEEETAKLPDQKESEAKGADDESAKKKLEAETAKLPDPKEGEAKGADDESAKKKLEAETAKLPDQKNSDEKGKVKRER